jgi:hypothetical protein
MDDALVVCSRDRPRNLGGNAERLLQPHGPGHQAIGERQAVNELHCEEGTLLPVLEPEQVRDVWMIQRGQRLGFALEAGEAIGTGSSTLIATLRPSRRSRAR